MIANCCLALLCNPCSQKNHLPLLLCFMTLHQRRLRAICCSFSYTPASPRGLVVVPAHRDFTIRRSSQLTFTLRQSRLSREPSSALLHIISLRCRNRLFFVSIELMQRRYLVAVVPFLAHGRREHRGSPSHWITYARVTPPPSPVAAFDLRPSTQRA
jgi:hypothetical protein